jgi:hypothetical protein
MSLKRGKDTKQTILCTYQEFTLVDEKYFPHAGCFSNRKFVRETPDLVTYIPLRAQRTEYDLVQTQNYALSPCMANVKQQTHPMSGHHDEANRCPGAIRHL